MTDNLDFKIESAFILYIEEFWGKFGKFPLDKDINQALGLNSAQIAELLSRKGVQASLDRRGIITSQGEGFTAIQLAAINAYLNLSDPRGDRTKLKDIGVSMNQWNGWWRDTKFRTYVMERANDVFTNETLANAQMAVSRKIKAGDPRILKLYFDVRRDTEQQQGISDVRQFMGEVIETIQRHIPDPDVLKSIARDFENILMGHKQTVAGEIENTPADILGYMADRQLAKGEIEI